MAQLVIRVDDGLVRAIDDLVESGAVDSRSDAVRRALRALVQAEDSRRTASRIREGYERIPQDDGPWIDAATEAMIAEEPW